MRILKRPSPSNTPAPAPAPSTSNTAAEALEEREARYVAARERIFGAEDEGKERETENKEKRQSERKEKAQAWCGIRRGRLRTRAGASVEREDCLMREDQRVVKK
ncbi:hypothetical protein C8R45DRAFT_1019899 [Mycena sanguinolenta]|nr:hypothetical protein C8R45DRAFT_1019899 [Mycena sanguinolenta]